MQLMMVTLRACNKFVSVFLEYAKTQKQGIFTRPFVSATNYMAGKGGRNAIVDDKITRICEMLIFFRLLNYFWP